MKRFLAFFLVAIMVMAVMPAFSAYAATGELLTNPGFEGGDEAGFKNYGIGCSSSVGKEYARTGSYGVLLEDRVDKYATYAWDVADILTLNGAGEYVATLWAKLADGEEKTGSCQLVLNVQETTASTPVYYGSTKKKLTTEWQQFTFKGKVSFDPKVGFTHALLYPQCYDGEYAPNIVVDDFSLVKNGEANGIPLDQVVKATSAPTKEPVSNTNTSSGKELLENPGFEEGDETGFFAYGAGCNMEVTEEYFRTGEFGMLLEDRGSRYSTYAQDISEILTVNGPGEYLGSVWMKLAEDSKVGGKAMLVINVKTKAGVQRYYTSAEKQLTNEWQQFAFKGNIDFDPKKGFEVAYIYQQTETTPDILIDDFSLKKLSAVNGIPLDQVEKDEYEDFKMSSINVFTEEREEETTIGAIRWDAWYTHDGRPESIVTQVENTLSLPEYHWRAPFFAKITDEGKIQMPEYTQEIFDKEMEYAKEAGIDYFSYLWYSGNMGMARKLHATSKYKNDVKFTICLDGNGIGKSECREEIKALLKEDFYMTVLNGRPLMYYYVNTGNKKDNMALCASEMKYYRAYCEAEGIPAPFVVLMNITGTEVQTLYGDAVSRYSFSGTSDMTFNDFITKVQSNWETFQKTGSQYVPYLTFGWHAEPRYKTPVTWMKVEENSWVPYPTEEELYNHIAYALSYMDHPSAKDFTKANTLILYAWNEHDEGSWLCPTLKTDEKGNQLYNDDGTPMIDDSRVKAVRKAIDDFKNGKRVEVFINGVSNLAGGATNTENPSGNGNGFGLWWIIPVAIVVVGGGVAAAVIILKKKKTEEK